MTQPVRRTVSRATWEHLKCTTLHHLSDPTWLGGSHQLLERVPAGRVSDTDNPWEDARFCSHYVWGTGGR